MLFDVRAFASAAVSLIPVLTLTLILERHIVRQAIRFPLLSQILVVAAGVGLIASLVALVIPDDAYKSHQSWPWPGLLLLLSAMGALALIIAVGVAVFRHVRSPSIWLGSSD